MEGILVLIALIYMYFNIIILYINYKTEKKLGNQINDLLDKVKKLEKKYETKR